MPAIELAMVTGAIIEMGVEGVWEKAKRREAVVKALKRVGLKPGEPPSDFEGVYAYTLIEYGIGKPEALLQFFRHEYIRNAFRQSFERRDPSILEAEAESLVEWHDVGDDLRRLDIDPRREFARFTAVFNEIVDRTRTPFEVKSDQKLADIYGDLHLKTAEILDRLGKLDELSEIRLEIERLKEDREARRFVLTPSGDKLKVFISSKMLELRDVREIVANALDEHGIEAWVYEANAGARPAGVVETSLREVEAADIYVGLFWQSYGEVTVQEYRHARALGKPAFVYVRDRDCTRDTELQDFLTREVYDLGKGVTYDFFDSAIKLGQQIAHDIMEWLVRCHREMTAEIREARVSKDEIDRLKQEVHRLQSTTQHPLPQGTAADFLAQQLRAWFEVLGYRFENYELRSDSLFEWIINVPARRGYDRVLVQGVDGEIQLEDVSVLRDSLVANRVDEGWLVSPRRVSQAARDALSDRENRGLYCYTFDELLDEHADFSGYLDWLESEIKRQRIDQLYVPLACSKDEYDSRTRQVIGESVYDERNGWIDGYIDRWLDDPSKEHISILGEFGTGKTWFALHYAWTAAQRYREAKTKGIERPRLPLVIPLRDYAKAVSVESLFSEFFFRKHEIPLPGYSAFEQLNRFGKLLLIFDGFDEMAARIDKQKMIDNFWELARVVIPGAKAILTCRNEHFPTAQLSRALLGAELRASTASLTGEPPQFEVLELKRLVDSQIYQILSASASPATVMRVMRHRQLVDLARRPVMLELILEALPDIEEGKEIDLARIYLYATQRKMERDIKAERTFTTFADKLYFMCELSWELLTTNQMTLNYRHFPDRLRRMFGPLVESQKELDYWHFDMMGQSMLIRDSSGDYTPAHRSLLEFFAAYKLAAELGGLVPDFVSILNKIPEPDSGTGPRGYSWSEFFQPRGGQEAHARSVPYIDSFHAEPIERLGGTFGRLYLHRRDPITTMMCDMIEKRALWDAIRATRKSTIEVCSLVGANSITILRSMGETLAGADFSGTILKGADFPGIFVPGSIPGYQFDPSDDRRTDLSGVNFSNAQLEDVILSYSDLTGANLVDARLVPGCRLWCANILKTTGLSREAYACASHQIPTLRRSSFLDGDADFDAVYEFAVGLTDSNVLVLTGMAGVGKSALAAAVARRLAQQIQGPPVYWYDIGDPERTRPYFVWPERSYQGRYGSGSFELNDRITEDSELLLSLATFLAVGGHTKLLEFLSNTLGASIRSLDLDEIEAAVSLGVLTLRTHQYALFIDDPDPNQEWPALLLLLEKMCEDPCMSKLIMTTLTPTFQDRVLVSDPAIPLIYMSPSSRS